MADKYVKLDDVLKLLNRNSITKAITFSNGISIYDSVQNLPTADVVPKSECDKWHHEYHAIKGELKQERLYHKATEKLADKYFVELKTAKSEVAREVLDEAIRAVYSKIDLKIYNTIEGKPLGDGVAFGKQQAMYDVINMLAELKKKHTGEKV